ncbi:MAG: cupin domain-containing protein [Gammaproteobacteria bacterium]|nr:cupin domain-containing protein [Gammaproteobacteria bacterium]MBV8308022.1 cupin domain-containing protein [Gammaproteobacteria bacterium]MBV8403463.1 cupin domain-containing protein [Gammaproteobacteria bacterium]
MSHQLPPDKSLAKPGAALKALRRQHGWTLAEVSERTGLPASTLSKIENDKMSLSFDKLARLSSGLQIDIAALFRGANGEDAPSGVNGRRSIVRAGEGKAIETRNYAHLYPAWELLNKKIIPIVAELHARSLEEFGELIHHPGEEYAFVLEGEVDFHTSLYAPVRLKAGDSIYFDSGMGHAYIAAGPGRCRVLSMCSAPETQLIAATRAPPKAERPPKPAATARKGRRSSRS